MNLSHHGGDLLTFAKRYGKRADDILDFSSNVNPLGLPPSLKSLYQASIREISRYPDPYGKPFCEALAEKFSVPLDCVTVGNGSISLLDVAIRAVLEGEGRPVQALIAVPCFTEYRRLLTLYGAEITAVRLQKELNFKFCLQDLMELTKGKTLVVLGHPNNPTGTAFERDELQRFIDWCCGQGATVIIDQAFCDWVPNLSAARAAADYDHLIVIGSLTKFYALAGIRSGYAVAPARYARRFKELLGPWNCNGLAQRLSCAALADLEFEERSRRWLAVERSRLVQAIESLGMFRAVPGAANFLLVSANEPLNDFYDFLGARGMYVRSTSDFESLGKDVFRIAVRKREENEALLNALAEWKQHAARGVFA